MITEVGKDIERAAALLRDGGLVAIPTETVYGLAANAFDADAVLRIFRVKERPAFDPLIVHVHDRAQADAVAHVTPWAKELILNFWPGPITLVLPKKPSVPDIVTSGLDTVGVRIPAHPMAQDLLRALDFPLAAPSANPFGYVSPTTARHVADQLGGKIPYILDGGPCMVGVESTIVGEEDGRIVLYRSGGVPKEAIEAVLGPLGGAVRKVMPVAPGMLDSHYAPRKPVLIGDVNALVRAHVGKRCAVIAFRDRWDAWRCETLSTSGDLSEAARRLFAVLRELDASNADLIIAERFPEEGLGRAINDRLGRAAAKR